jgi:hypothetical protein
MLSPEIQSSGEGQHGHGGQRQGAGGQQQEARGAAGR